jgi:hypothetical protein
MTMKKILVLSVAAAAAAAIVVGVVSASGDHPRAPRTSLSVFERSQRPSDRLPVVFAQGSISSHFRNADSRRVGSYHGTTWYAVPGRHHTLCLAGLAHGKNVLARTFGPCTDMRVLARRAIVFFHASGPDWGGSKMEVAGLANDGLTRAQMGRQTKKIRNNAFFFTVPADKPLALRLTGPGVRAHVFQLPLGPTPHQ